MRVHLMPVAAMAGVALALGGCGSTRFGGPVSTASAARPVPAYNAPAPAPEPVPAMPSGPVTSEPLPPLPGAPAPIISVAPGPGLASADVPVMPGRPRPIETLQPAPPQAPVQVANAAPSSRSAVFGSWTAREASGTSCRVQLSSAPALDLYKASASGCGNRDLARVTAWDFREGEVYLYQPGGSVAARLRTSGTGMDGVLAKSGAPLAMSR